MLLLLSKITRKILYRESTGFKVLATTIQYGCTQGDSVHRKIIVSDKVPETLAFYSHAVQVDNVLYVSGNLGMTIDGYLVDGVTNQTKLALDNIGHILEAAGVSFDHVVKVTVILSDMQDYGAMNEVYKLYFTEKAPARSAFMATLPRDAKVEIEAVAIVGHIVDVDEQGNNAPRLGVALQIVMFIQSVLLYQMMATL